MLGIGGGAIMVPLLVMLFEAQGLPKAHILHLAVGTGMATILFTSVASVRAHAARGVIRWDITRRITPGILLGGLAGSWIASFIPTAVFAAIFTGVIYIAATNLLLDRKPRASREPPGWVGASERAGGGRRWARPRRTACRRCGSSGFSRCSST